MVVLGNGDITSASSSSSSSESESGCDVPPLEGDLLMVRRLMWSVREDRYKTQRANIFHTRCMVMGKICSLIIDGGSCTNVAIQRLIENLALKTSPHPRPYKLQWLSENGELVVDRQIFICFSIGKYVNQTLFDVVPRRLVISYLEGLGSMIGMLSTMVSQTNFHLYMKGKRLLLNLCL